MISGTTSPFVISLKHFVVGFQLRSQRIRVRTFTGNFQALLNEASRNRLRWTVTPRVKGQSFEAWLETVVRVEILRIRLERPNPTYPAGDQVERLVEGAKAAAISMAIRARRDSSGVNVNDAFIREAIAHADDYGAYTAVGVRREFGEELSSRWDSTVDGTPERDKLPVDATTSEVSHDAIRRELQDLADKEDEDDETGGHEDGDE